ncbi:MAG TPA: hypothetical protein VFJ19_06065 [Nocardioidaceae bacterium]|jgi:hypothetical protein|nr:hypothetical protein [Nocardioidaceae bacterium]
MSVTTPPARHGGTPQPARAGQDTPPARPGVRAWEADHLLEPPVRTPGDPVRPRASTVSLPALSVRELIGVLADNEEQIRLLRRAGTGPDHRPETVRHLLREQNRIIGELRRRRVRPRA